ncbi:MAG: SDR family oxidoreductase, partial [Pseudomonadota bacterium]
MGYLTDKTAIITGASSGIGRAVARLFASEGASVILAARREAELQDLADEIKAYGGAAIALPGDVTDEGYHQALVECARDRFGGVDIAINNAGTMGSPGPIADMARDTWHDTLDTNLTSAFLAAKHQIPAMVQRGGGSLIFTGSFVGHTVGFPGVSAYAAAKAGLIGLTKALAVEAADDNIRVNVLLPGGTETPM